MENTLHLYEITWTSAIKSLLYFFSTLIKENLQSTRFFLRFSVNTYLYLRWLKLVQTINNSPVNARKILF